MSERDAAQLRQSAVAAEATYPEDIEPELQATLSILAGIETRYEQERESLSCWPGPDAIKARLAHVLEERHRHNREPYVQRLAELHSRIMSVTMFRGLRTMH